MGLSGSMQRAPTEYCTSFETVSVSDTNYHSIAKTLLSGVGVSIGHKQSILRVPPSAVVTRVGIIWTSGTTRYKLCRKQR